MPETMQTMRPKQTEFIVDENDRIFKVFGTVDIVDKQNERLKVHPYFDKIMPKIMKRGGVITAGHTDQQCGKILNYEFTADEVTGLDGVLLTVQMFDDYDTDDSIWNAIKSGELPAVSFKGRGEADIDWSQINMEDTEKVVKVFEGYGFAIVPNPANPRAVVTEINYLAKSGIKEVILKVDVSKPFAGYENFDACVNENRDKENPDAYCAAIMHQVEGEKSKDAGLGQKLKLISQPEQKNSSENTDGVDNMTDEKKDEVKSEFVTKQEYSELVTKMDALSVSVMATSEAVKALAESIKANKEDKKPDEDEEEEKSLEDKIVEKVAATVEKRFEKIEKSMTPRPGMTNVPKESRAYGNVNDFMKSLEKMDGTKMIEISKELAEKEARENDLF